MFINESLTGFFLGRVERVNLSDLRDKRVFEFDGVIKGLMRGEDIVSLLREDICEVNAEIRDRDFLRFVSLSELCRDGDLVYLFS